MTRSFQQTLAFISVIAVLPASVLLVTLPGPAQSGLTGLLILLAMVAGLAWSFPAAGVGSGRRIDWFHPKLLFLGFFTVYFLVPAIRIDDASGCDLEMSGLLISDPTIEPGFHRCFGQSCPTKKPSVIQRANESLSKARLNRRLILNQLAPAQVLQ